MSRLSLALSVGRAPHVTSTSCGKGARELAWAVMETEVTELTAVPSVPVRKSLAGCEPQGSAPVSEAG